MNMIIKWIYRLLGFVILIVLVTANFRYYNGYKLNLKESVEKQLNFLSTEIRDGADTKMQNMYPEGYIFMNTLYGLTWCELSLQNPNNKLLRNKALKEASFALHNIESNQAIKIFVKDMNPSYGIFYQGWVNYLRAKILLLYSADEPDILLLNRYLSACTAIDSSLIKSKIPFLESYPGYSWPADMFPAIISLVIHDRLFQPKYQETILRFLSQVKQKTDPQTNLIPHQTDFLTGVTIKSARGSSQGLIIRLLAEIDSSLAVEKYKVYRKLFSDQFMGLNAIKEHSNSSREPADIDSGPVIFGYGSAAMIVGIAASRSVGDYTASNDLIASIETVGFPFTYKDKKNYVFGLLPMADVFIAWSTVTPSYIVNARTSYVKHENNNRNKFHFISILIIIVLLIPESYFLYRASKMNRK